MTAETEEKKAVVCPNCNANVMDTGFVVELRAYQSYNRARSGKLVRGHVTKSSLRMAHCSLCHAVLTLDASELTGSKSA